MALAILDKMLIQDALYWGAPKADGRAGKTLDATIAIRVRWQDSDEMFVDAEGKEVRAKAKVFIDWNDPVVVEVGGYLFLGTANDLAALSDDNPIRAGQEIRKYSDLPTLKGDQSLRTAVL